MIAIEGVRRAQGGQAILAGVDLAVARGESIALLGANGAGKSTLLKALVDIGGIDAGRITIDGIDHRDHRARAVLAYLPERFQPPHYLRGREFLHAMRALYGRKANDAEVAATAAALGLAADDLDKPVQAYSQGMVQMLGLAACLLAERPLLVLDEPMSGLDPVARQRLADALGQRHAAGTTLLFTTHLLADAELLADRVAILHAGRIAALGTPAALCQRFDAPDLGAAFAACVRAADAA